jgi:hypothetical protein
MSAFPDGDLYVNGNVGAKTMTLPAGCVRNANIGAGAAGDYIDPTKLKSRRIVTYAQDQGANNTAKQSFRHQVYGATGTLRSLRCRNKVAASGTDKTSVDLLINGVTVLSAPLALDLAAGTGEVHTESFVSAALAQGDTIEFKTTLTGTNVGQGVFVELVFDEDPQ